MNIVLPLEDVATDSLVFIDELDVGDGVVVVGS